MTCTKRVCGVRRRASSAWFGLGGVIVGGGGGAGGMSVRGSVEIGFKMRLCVFYSYLVQGCDAQGEVFGVCCIHVVLPFALAACEHTNTSHKTPI